MPKNKLDCLIEDVSERYLNEGIILPKFDLYCRDLNDYGMLACVLPVKGIFCRHNKKFQQELDDVCSELCDENPSFASIKDDLEADEKLTDNTPTVRQVLRDINLEYLLNFYNKIKHPFSNKYLVVINNKEDWFKDLKSAAKLVHLLGHEFWHICEEEFVQTDSQFALIKEGTATYVADRLHYSGEEFSWLNDLAENSPNNMVRWRSFMPAKVVQDYMKDKDNLKILFRPEVRKQLNEEVKKQLKLLMLEDLQEG